MTRLGLRAAVLALTVSVCGASWAVHPDSLKHYQAAAALERSGRLPEAEAELKQAIGLDPHDYLNYVKMAGVLAQQGRTREAISYYQQALQFNSTDPMIHLSIGALQEQLGEYAQAEQSYMRLMQQHTGYPYGLFSLAKVNVQQGDYEEAISQYRQFLAQYPEHYDARRNLARVLLATDNFTAARTEYESLKVSFPQHFKDHLELAKALNRTESPEQALEELKQAYALEGGKADIVEEIGNAHLALDQLDYAVLNYQKALSLAPAKDYLWVRLAELYHEKKQPDQTIEAYRNYLATHPENGEIRQAMANVLIEEKKYDSALAEFNEALLKTKDANRRYDLQKQIAYAHQLKGDTAEAVERYEALVGQPQAETDWQLKLNLALAYHKNGALDKAALAYKTLMEAPVDQLAQQKIQREAIANDLANTLTGLGDRAYRDKNFEQALVKYGEATLFANEKNHLPYLGLANTYYAQGNREKAEQTYQVVLGKDPGNVIASLYQAKLALEREEYQVALPRLQALVEKNPQNLDVLLALGEAYMKMGDPAQAVLQLEKAVQLDPKNDQVLLALGSHWQQLEQPDKALGYYEKAQSLGSKLPMVYYNLGILYNEKNRLPESVAAYEKALSLDPQNRDARYGLAVTYEKQKKYLKALESYEAYLTEPEGRYHQQAQERIGLLRKNLNLPTEQKLPSVEVPIMSSVVEPPTGGKAPAKAPAKAAPAQQAPSDAPVIKTPFGNLRIEIESGTQTTLPGLQN